jgi:hypothetical protein
MELLVELIQGVHETVRYATIRVQSLAIAICNGYPRATTGARPANVRNRDRKIRTVCYRVLWHVE